jgi:hypothetical protein
VFASGEMSSKFLIKTITLVSLAIVMGSDRVFVAGERSFLYILNDVHG